MNERAHSLAVSSGPELSSQGWAQLRAEAQARDGNGHFGSSLADGASPLAERCGALYAPLAAARRFVLAQVGQSLDGRVATVSGDARDISGAAGLRHLHRCRALVDAIVVGVGTVVADDPSLTVRLVEGNNPVRVVVDPRGRIPPGARMLHDGAAPVVVLHGQDVPPPDLPAARCIGLPVNGQGRLAPARILAALSELGLHRVLVEGGACTVATFLEAECLDRLHVAIAPLIIGAGPSGIALTPVQRLAQARRPRVVSYDLGGEVVFDCDLRQASAATAG